MRPVFLFAFLTTALAASDVQIVSASYIGGDGAEYLAGGAILPDGRLAVAGNLLSPSSTIGSVQPVLLGKDHLAAPQAIAQTDDNVPAALGWRTATATPFIALLGADAATVERVVRLPWCAGGLTDLCVDAAGRIYITGRVGKGFAGIPNAIDASDTRDWGSDFAYLVQLDPTLASITWTRTVVDAAKGPALRAMKDTVILDAGWRYVFTADGIRAQTHPVRKLPTGSTWVRAISPRTNRGSFAGHTVDGVGMHGGGGWWSPFLEINHGTRDVHRMFNFPEALCRNQDLGIKISSASRFIRLRYAGEDTLYAVGWAHGMNHPLLRDPFDFRRGAGKITQLHGKARGSDIFYHLMAIDPATAAIRTHLRWKENHLFHIAPATDGSVLLALSGGTGDLLTEAEFADDESRFESQVVVLDRALKRVRFGAPIPECASVHLALRDDLQSANTTCATVHGRHRALLLTGGRVGATTHDAAQQTYGGGAYDGYLLLLDLGSVKPLGDAQ